ncbi:DUF6090 family protein [Algoriphagus litoralis]|uniref:DUF6090 family protein n=1 Tax=Algoriphagus litoralis TaxID=2202829 RepID=UPI001300B4FB|nr:DUF6090 family protein [Algoriphagus litoralis]
MIPYLQKIRRKLLAENRVSKYLVYATGEIILVVIGILIAVAVNNYSERNKAVNQSSLFLRDMLDDLASDTAYLSKMLLQIDNQLALEDWMLKKQEFEPHDLDSIRLAVAKGNWTFTINDRSFQNIQNSSYSKLIGYEELYAEVSKYYMTTKARVDLNNQTELLAATKKSEFDEVLEKNLLISTREFLDYSGVKISMDFPGSQKSGDAQAIFESLAEISTKNTLFEKNARHNFIYTALILCNYEAKALVKRITAALENNED